MSISEITPIIVAALASLASIAGAWFTSRAGARKEHGAISDRVRALEETESEDVKAARELADKAHALAEKAHTVAQEIGDDLRQFVASERERRRAAREAGQKRDDAITHKVDDLIKSVSAHGAQLSLLLESVDVTSRGSRRG